VARGLDALTDCFPGIQIALVGTRRRAGRTTTSLTAGELAELLASDLFLSPHPGFGMAALSAG
jgi:hypothetical protein